MRISNGVDRVRLRQIYYRESHYPEIVPPALPYDNRGGSSHLCEYGVFEKEYDTLFTDGFEYEGLISWRFSRKTGWSVREFVELCRAEPGRDLYAVQPYPLEQFPVNLWHQAEVWHPGIVAFTRSVFSAVGYDVSLIDKVQDNRLTVTCNYWYANKRFWRLYMSYVSLIAQYLHSIAMERESQYEVVYGSVVSGSWVPGYFPYIIERVVSTLIYLNPDISHKVIHCTGDHWKNYSRR